MQCPLVANPGGRGQRWAAVVVAVILAPIPCHSAELASEPASHHSLPAQTVLDGLVEPVQQSTVAAQVVGRIVEINFDVDDFVPKDSVLMRFHDAEQRARLMQERAGIQAAQSRSREAQLEFDRIKNLHARKLAARSELDRVQAALETAAAQLKAAQARLRGAEEQLAQTVVIAPYSGVVVRRHVEVGETVQVGQPLMTGFSLDQLRVVTQIPQGLIDEIRENMRATVWLADGRQIAAESLVVYPIADARSHTFKARIGLPAGLSGAYPGSFVKVAFVSGERERLVVPRRAVVHRSEVTAVYVLGGDGRIAMRQVRVGAEYTEDMIEILAGLEAGEQVILDPIQAGAVLHRQRAAGHE